MPQPDPLPSGTGGVRRLFIGVDVGGTNIKLGLVDEQGHALRHDSLPTEEPRGPADAVERIHRASDRLLQACGRKWDEVAGIGLGTPGTQDVRRGLILEPPNMPHWRHFAIRDAVAKACGKPCSYANDANAAAFGEFWVGAGRGHRSLVMFTLGTGVGGGIINEGQLIDGLNSFGSELGHIIIDSRDDARLCVWGGGRGELEAYASASAVVAWARELLDAGEASSVRNRLAQGEPLSTKLLAEEAEAGDKFSRRVILETARYLGIGITTVVHAVDPGMVVLGGAMTFGGDAHPLGRQFLEAVRAEFHRRCFNVVAQTRIEYAMLGGDAGWIGAAGIACAAWKSTVAQRSA